MIETERLILRELTDGDFEDLYAVLGDSDIMRHYPYTFDERRVRNWIAKNIERYRVFGYGLFAAVRKSDGRMIGDCGITMQNINGFIRPEIGYHFSAECQHKGYASEAAAACRDFAFEKCNFGAVNSYMHADNYRSRMTAVSIGMSLVEIYSDEDGQSTAVYGICRAEWEKIHSGESVFTRAGESDKATVKLLYASVVGEEYCTWNNLYPGELEIDTDVANGNLYLLKSGNNVIGAGSVVGDNELDGLSFWHFDSENAAEIARIAVLPEHRGLGLAAVIVGRLEERLRARGKHSVRLLVAKKNIPAYKTYIKCEYTVVGECEMYGNEYFACEKKI